MGNLADNINEFRDYLNERPSFAITDLRLSYTCPHPECRAEFIFSAEIKSRWTECPACKKPLATSSISQADLQRDPELQQWQNSDFLLWQTVWLYKQLHRLATTHEDFKLRVCQSSLTAAEKVK